PHSSIKFFRFQWKASLYGFPLKVEKFQARALRFRLKWVAHCVAAKPHFLTSLTQGYAGFRERTSVRSLPLTNLGYGWSMEGL
ncbi:MAG: hypothetical protein ACO3NK_02050, partial [Prochlorotrichaceae cyanobacterium]